MSFFSRLSNLVSGVAHGFLDSVERNNPHVMQEQKIEKQRQYYQNLKEAAAQYHKLEQDLEEEIARASDEQIEELQREKARIGLEKADALRKLETAKAEFTRLKMGIPDALLQNTSTAEDQLSSIRSHIERKHVESELFASKPRPSSAPTTSEESEDPAATDPASEEDETGKKQRRTNRTL